jgi:predicted NBD/HSP70 family sugar kinase
VGIPGTLAANTRIFTLPPHMPGWDGVNLQQALRTSLNVPVFVDNDANLGALGESRYGIGNTFDNFVYMKVGTGIGTGTIIDRQIFRGSGGFAGELGHISIGEDGPQCDCGSRGCLETLAGADAIMAEACANAAPGSLLDEVRACKPQLDIADVIAAAQKGDEASRVAIIHAGERMGVALSNLINIFDPAAIIIDGSVSKAGDLLIVPLMQKASSITLRPSWQHTTVMLGELDNLAIALGGVATVIDQAFEPVPFVSYGVTTADA